MTTTKARFLPWAIAWITILMSARIWDQLPYRADVDAPRALFTFGGVPLIAFAVVLLARAAEKRTGSPVGRGSSFVLAWVIAFLLALHGAVLAQAIGKIQTMMVVLPPAISIFFLGLGPLVAMLEPASAMGIRTKTTLANEAKWRKTHLLLGVSFAIAGGLGIAGTAIRLEVPARMAFSVLPGVLALVVAIAYGSRD